MLGTAAAAALSGCARVASVSVPSTPNDWRIEMKSRPLTALRLTTDPTQDLGLTQSGGRVIFPINGGAFEGERLAGKVLPGGADWTLRRPDGAMELDMRLTLETHDAALVYMTFTGLRDDAHHYFRTIARFETAAPRYAFLNRLLAAGEGKFEASGPVHVFEEIL
jgi:Protein of unknown function (DUF3237)